ncbi:solute carrier family 12 member kcc [Augochlora pura]
MERFRVTPANSAQFAQQQQQSMDYDPPVNGTQLEHQHLVPRSLSERDLYPFLGNCSGDFDRNICGNFIL